MECPQRSQKVWSHQEKEPGSHCLISSPIQKALCTVHRPTLLNSPECIQNWNKELFSHDQQSKDNTSFLNFTICLTSKPWILHCVPEGVYFSTLTEITQESFTWLVIHILWWTLLLQFCNLLKIIWIVISMPKIEWDKIPKPELQK